MKKTKSKSDNYLSGIWRRHFFPVVIWLGIVGCIVILFKHRTQRIEVMGLVQGYEGEVAAVRLHLRPPITAPKSQEEASMHGRAIHWGLVQARPTDLQLDRGLGGDGERVDDL